MRRRVLIADDTERVRHHIRAILSEDDRLEVEETANGAEALRELTSGNYSILLTDLLMPGLDGMQLIEKIRERELPVTVIVMTGHGSIDQAVQAMRLGAHDFLTKPLDADQLRLVIDRALRERALADELVELRERLQRQHSFGNIISKSPRMHAVFELISNLAHTTTTVLIVGETGTGKEQVAEAIHSASLAHRRGEFVAVNCAALPETLLESELFGHEKGAFTSAVGQRRGRFEIADGGTLFLDEAGDIPLTMQAKLLRVLQERRFERVGGTTPIEVDVRVIAATHRDLKKQVRRGKFREDLYYRLNVVRIELPPLRERLEDVPLLAAHFVSKYARRAEAPKTIAPEAMERLLAHSWPGNVRELENAIERACVTARGPSLEVRDLPPEVLTPRVILPTQNVDINRPLPELLSEMTNDLEKRYLQEALKRTRGHVGHAARICGLSRRSISSKLALYGFDKAVFRLKD
jgi:DNA-binding NtrC family response regulator